MSKSAIATSAKWWATRCKDDPKCIAADGHKGDHRDLNTTWPREDE